MNANVAGTADSGLYCVGPNCAPLMPTVPTLLGSVASASAQRFAWVTSTTVVNSVPSRRTVNSVGPCELAHG